MSAYRSAMSVRSSFPDGIPDDDVLFLSDILPTGWQAAEFAANRAWRHRRGVGLRARSGLFAVQSAFLMGAERVIAIDHFPHRLELAAKFGAETINFEESETYEALMLMTGGIGPDACIDAVGTGGARTCSSTMSSTR